MVNVEKDENILRRQYGTPKNLAARKSLRDFLVPRIDIHEKALDSLNLKGHESILDVGCGDGYVLYNLRQERNHKGRLVGIDMNAGMFEEINKFQKKTKLPQIELIVGNAESLPFPDKSFDVVTAFFMLYHVSDLEKVLSEFKRVLKKDGKLLIATMGVENRKDFETLRPDYIVRKSSFSLETGGEF